MDGFETGHALSVIVVGGVNVDIGGRSFGPLVEADSNPGKVTVTLGGVGRNIAHNLRLLGVSVGMLTALGDDANGQQVRQSCAQLGIDLSHALTVPGGTTSTYLYLTDPAGEMVLAVSDMGICDAITGEYLRSNSAVLKQADIIIADTNIPGEALEYLAGQFGDKLFIDPVSTQKAGKILPILGSIHTLKPNKLEAELLTGIPVKSPEDARAAAKALLKSGVKRVFLSMGGSGVCAAEGDQILWLQALPGNMVNTTGCGDAFMAGLVWATLEGMPLRDIARAGLAAGSVAMESALTIAPHMSAGELKKRMR